MADADHTPAAPSLDAVRARLDAIDAQLFGLIDERAGLARQVAAAKEVGSFDGLTAKDKAELAAGPAALDAPSADVESSYAFQRMTTNLITGKQHANKALDKKYDMTVSAEAELAASPTAPAAAPPVAHARRGASMRVLEKKGDMAKVRDDEGNEGWLPAAQVTKR